MSEQSETGLRYEMAMHAAVQRAKEWRICALVFAALLIFGSMAASWALIRSGDRIHELEQQLRCYRGAAEGPVLR